jgi:hypothetical protein
MRERWLKTLIERGACGRGMLPIRRSAAGMEVLRGRVQRRQRGAHGRAATCDVEGAGGKEDEWGFGGQVRLLAGVFEQRLLEAGSGQHICGGALVTGKPLHYSKMVLIEPIFQIMQDFVKARFYYAALRLLEGLRQSISVENQNIN